MALHREFGTTPTNSQIEPFLRQLKPNQICVTTGTESCGAQRIFGY